MRKPRTAALAGAALAVAAACSGNLDTPDRVHDLRLLAVRADPPEEVIAVISLPDGGVFPALVDGGLPSLAPVGLTVLIADPDGGGRSVSWQMSVCAALDNDAGGRCTTDSPGYSMIGTGAIVVQDVGAEPTATFQPDFGFLATALANDPYHGFGGLQVPVEVDISAGDESVAGIKRVVFTLASGELPAPNQNPGLLGVTLNDAGWDPDAGVTLSGTVSKGNKTSGTNTVAPVPDPSLIETYTRPTFQGGTVTLTESWRYDFYTTGGTFGPASTGGARTGQTDVDITSNWTPLAGEVSGPVVVWIVVTDGRGGETWVVRHANASVGP
jgi:hypothetical protein